MPQGGGWVQERIDALLSADGWRNTTVAYKANRIVIFNSNLLHKTDRLRFRDRWHADHTQLIVVLPGRALCAAQLLGVRLHMPLLFVACLEERAARRYEDRRINITFLYGRRGRHRRPARAR